MKRGYSGSTVILVALLLGVLFWVGKVVNPPIKGGHDDHDEEKPAAPAQAPASAKTPPPKQVGQRSVMPPPPTENKGEVKAQTPNPPRTSVKTPPKGSTPPPKSDGMDASFWQEHDMGVVTPAPEIKPH